MQCPRGKFFNCMNRDGELQVGYRSLEAVSFKVTNLAGTTTEFKYGDLISNIIDFVIIAFLVFLAYKQLSKHGFIEDKTKPAEEKK